MVIRMPFKTASGKLLYRVGDVIISTNSQNPSEWYGGTWQLFAPGRTLVCIDTSQSEFNSIKKTGGSKYMQQHNHSASTNSPSLRGSFQNRYYDSKGSTDIVAINYSETGIVSVERNITWSGAHGSPQSMSSNVNNPKINKVNIDATHSHTVTINNSGNGNAQNLQPYMVVYMWIRIA